MRRETRRRIILTSLLALPVAFTALLFFYSATPHLDFVTALARIEEVQFQRGSLASRASYRQAARLAQTPDHWLSLLKRLYLHPQHPLLPRYLLDLTTKAVQSFPQDPSLQAFHQTALLENQELSQALARIPLLGPRYNGLKAETLLRYLARNATAVKEDLTLRDILTSSQAEDYQRVAQWLDSPLLLYNSALLFLQQGQKERAWRISQQLPADQGLPQYVLGLIAYNQGQFSQAITHFLLERDQKGEDAPVQLDQLIGDSYLQLGQPDQAIGSYQRAQQRGGSWHSYYNQAYAYLLQQDQLAAFGALRDGLNRFVTEEKLLIRLVAIADEEHRGLTAQLVNEFLKQYDRNADIELLSLILNSEQLSHTRQRIRLWQLFNYYPENKNVGQYLVWYLLGLNYLEQAKVAVERMTRRQGDPPPWLAFYQGLLALLDQQPQLAYDLLAQAAESQPSAEVFFNLAQAQVQLGQWRPAYQTLRKGLRLGPRLPGLFVSLLRQVARQLDMGDDWREGLPSHPPKGDPLFDLVEGMYLHDYPQDPGSDSHVTPVGADTGRDFSAP